MTISHDERLTLGTLPTTPAATGAGSAALRGWVLLLPLIAATFLSKFAVPPLGARGIGITLGVILGAWLLGCMTNLFRIAPLRLALFSVIAGLMGAQLLLMGDAFSKSSLLLFVTLHIPFLFYLRAAPQDIERAANAFAVFAAIFALGAMAQFFLQFAIPVKLLFPIETFLPEDFRIHLYNNQAAMGYGSHVYRANGVFMMEPSFLSQFLAIAIVLELSRRNRWWMQAIYGVGLLVSYSGTGIMILALCVPLLVIAKRRWDFLVLLLFLVALVAAFGEQLFLDKLLSRINEFHSTGSSGFARFVGGFYMFDQFMWGHPLRTLFGYGAGSFKDYMTVAHYPVAEMPLFKMVFEFGVVGAALYFSFLFYCLFASPAPKLVALAVAMTFFLNGLYVPFSHGIALSLLIWTSQVDKLAPAASPVERNTRSAPRRRPALAYRVH